MSGRAWLALPLATLAVLLLTAGASGLHAQQKVGVNSAVNTDAQGTPPGAATRKLVIGQEVVFNEHITTSSTGQTQLLFLDESSMSIGPDSDLTIDQFVYDPKTGTGKLAMSATRGLLRYVGGKLSKQDDAVTLRTSSATLAVRGGSFISDIERTGRTETIFAYGRRLTVDGLCGVPAVQCGVPQTLTRPGFAVTVAGPGAQPSPPAPEPAGRLAELLARLDGRTGGNGGAPVIPTDATVAASGVSQTISGDLPQSVLQSQLNTPTAIAYLPQPLPFTPVINPNPVPVQVIAPPETQAPAATAGQTISTSSGPAPPPPPPPTPPAPPSSLYAGRLKNTNGNGTTRGFVDQSANGDIAYSGGTLANGVFTGTFGNLGVISFPLAAGTASFGPGGTSSSLGTFTGTSFLSADNTFFYANITPTSQPAQRLFVYGGIPVNAGFYQPTGNTRVFAFTVQPDAALQSNIPFIRGQAGGNLANASVSPLYVVAPPTTPIGNAAALPGARALQASLAINGQGANQQSAIAVTTGTIAALQSNGQPVLNGQLRGSSLLSANSGPTRIGSAASSTVDGNGNSFYGGGGISGFVVDQTAYANGSTPGTVGSATIPSTASEVPFQFILAGGQTTYGFAQAALPAALPSGVGAGRTTQALSGNFGGLMYTTAQTNPYVVTGGTLISTDAPNNRIQASLAGAAQSPSAGVNTLTMQYGGLTGDTGGRQAFIDNNNFAALESTVNPQQINGQTLVVNGDPTQAGKLYLVSSGAAGTSSSILPSGVSYCACQFLQWGYWGGDLMTGSSTSSTISRVDRGHINTWVAGVATPLNDINSLIGTSATATYTGHAIGSVFNNGASYVAAGGFAGAYNFGTQTGTLSVNNFDGHSFTVGPGRLPLTGANYSFRGNLAPGFNGAINGSFYGPMAAETGGSFAVQSTVGPTYLASGIFAGKR